MGAVDLELDLVLVEPGEPVRVRAVVEAKRNPDGRFRSARHQGHLFQPESFAQFRGRPDDPFYLVSRSAPIWGVHSSGIARLSRRVAEDSRFGWSDQTYLSQLRNWFLGICHCFETPDLLRLYSLDDTTAGRLLLVGEEPRL